MKFVCLLVNSNMNAVVGAYDSTATVVGCLEATYGPGGLTQVEPLSDGATRFRSRDGIVWSLAEHSVIEEVASLGQDAMLKG